MRIVGVELEDFLGFDVLILGDLYIILFIEDIWYLNFFNLNFFYCL